MSGELVLVSGASGYLGSQCAKNCLEKGYRVRGTVRSLKNEQKVAFLRNLMPGAKYPLELVEADLLDAESWHAAVKGCKYILHTASPFVMKMPKDENELIKPAVEGTLAVLRAAAADGNVKRVVVTSSYAAIEGREKSDAQYTEEDWSIPEKQLTAYNKSKTLAERAAWKFVEDLPDGQKFELCTMNPVAIFGPVLSTNPAATIDIMAQLMEKKMGAVPKIFIPWVDVRDCAEAHSRALENDAAVGKRHILFTENITFPDLCKWLDEEFKPQGYKVTTGTIANPIVRFLSLFSSELRTMWTFGKVERDIANARFKNVLGINPVPAKQSALEMAYTLIEHGVVHKTDKYTGPPAN